MTNASIYFDKHIIIIIIIQHNLARSREEDESSKMAPTQWCQIRVPSSAHITSAYCTRNANGLLADPHYSPQFSLFWAEDIFFRRRHRYSRLHEILFFFAYRSSLSSSFSSKFFFNFAIFMESLIWKKDTVMFYEWIIVWF